MRGPSGNCLSAAAYSAARLTTLFHFAQPSSPGEVVAFLCRLASLHSYVPPRPERFQLNSAFAF